MSERLTEHFLVSEFDCKCGNCWVSGKQMQEHFMAGLEEARQIAGRPFVITSGMRCPEYNRQVGGVDSSAHLSGWAADISARGFSSRASILFALRSAGFNRIGIANSFIHVDSDPDKPTDVVWLY